MPHTPLSELRPRDFPKIGDEENALDSDNEDTDDDSPEDATHDEMNETDNALLLQTHSRNMSRCNIL